MSELNPILLLKEKPGRALAVKAMCAHCMGCTEDHLEPGFRRLIRDCSSFKCPLWSYRPYKVKNDSKVFSDGIYDYKITSTTIEVTDAKLESPFK